MSKNLNKPIIGVLLATVGILLVPFVAMQFTSEVNWSVGDFVIGGVIIFVIGLALVLANRLQSNIIYRLGMSLGILTTFFMIWSNLAVGLIGAGPHWGNLMYMGVILVYIAGIVNSRFTSSGMEKAMYMVAASLGVLTGIAILAGMADYPSSSVTEIIAVNGFFAFFYIISGLLFRYINLRMDSSQQ